MYHLLLATSADLHLTDALQQVVSYFTTNINPVVTAVVGIAVFVWFIKFALRSFGITSIEAGIFQDDDGDWGARLEAFGDSDDEDQEERYHGHRWEL
jgi:hypothetical protein